MMIIIIIMLIIKSSSRTSMYCDNEDHVQKTKKKLVNLSALFYIYSLSLFPLMLYDDGDDACKDDVRSW